MKYIFSLNNIISTLFVYLVLALLPYFFEIDFLNPIENTLESFSITDMYFSQLQNHDEIPVDSNIVLVNIGDLKRRGIAKQIEIISRYDPKVIGIDAFFRDEKEPMQDVPLINAIKKSEKIVLVTKIANYDKSKKTHDTVETSHDKFTQSAYQGYANFYIPKDDFRTVRKFSPKENLHDTLQYSFAVEVARNYDSAAVDRLLERDNGLEIINFRRGYDKYITLSTKDVFVKRNELDFIKDKIVLLGFMGPNLITPTDGDIFFTPMNDNFVGKSYPDMYGVEVHANIISMILDGKYFEMIPDWLSFTLTILLVYFNMAFFSYLRDKREGLYEPISIIATFGELILVFLFILWFFYLFGIEIRASGVFFAIILLKQIYELYNDSIKQIAINFFKRRFQ